MASKNIHTQRSQCPIACGLDIVGDHWTLLVVRDLLILGKHEYREMLEGDEGISSNILTDRLTKLQLQGLVESICHPESKKRKLYYLTHKGKDLIYVLMAIARWSNKHLGDQVMMPPERRKLIQLGPDKFIQHTLQQLAQWEQEYGVNQTS